MKRQYFVQTAWHSIKSIFGYTSARNEYRASRHIDYCRVSHNQVGQGQFLNSILSYQYHIFESIAIYQQDKQFRNIFAIAQLSELSTWNLKHSPKLPDLKLPHKHAHAHAHPQPPSPLHSTGSPFWCNYGEHL